MNTVSYDITDPYVISASTSGIYLKYLSEVFRPKYPHLRSSNPAKVSKLLSVQNGSELYFFNFIFILFVL